MNSYSLSRNFFNWCFEHSKEIKPTHIAIYFFAIEHCNRMGWKDNFGFSTNMAMEATGIKSYNTYINAFNNLVNWGFIKLLEKSKNQWSSNIIALSKNDKALDKALIKHVTKHVTKQSESTVQSTVQSTSSIIKQGTRNKEPGNQEPRTEIQTAGVMKIIYPFNSETFLGQWQLWRQFKKEQFNFKYKPIGEQGALKELSELSAGNEELAVKIIHQSIQKGWKGFFELKNQSQKQFNNGKSNRPQTPDEQLRETIELSRQRERERQAAAGTHAS